MTGRNTVRVHDGLVVVKLRGAQNGDTLERTLAEAMFCVQKLLESQSQVDTLVDVRAATDTTLSARMEVQRSIKHMASRKIAIFGANLKLRTVVNLIITSARASGRVRMFQTEAEALRWLKE